MTLPNIRRQIDAIDLELLHLLEQRVQLALQAREHKPKAHDPEREKEVGTTWLKESERLGLDARKIKAVLDAIVDLTRCAQEP